MSKYPPTPWIVRTQVKVGPYRGGYYLARNVTEPAIAWAKDEATAAFIALAVSSYDQLNEEIEALKHDIERHLKIISEYENGVPASVGDVSPSTSSLSGGENG